VALNGSAAPDAYGRVDNLSAALEALITGRFGGAYEGLTVSVDDPTTAGFLPAHQVWAVPTDERARGTAAASASASAAPGLAADRRAAQLIYPLAAVRRRDGVWAESEEAAAPFDVGIGDNWLPGRDVIELRLRDNDPDEKSGGGGGALYGDEAASWCRVRTSSLGTDWSETAAAGPHKDWEGG
jgi:hypothetical protein